MYVKLTSHLDHPCVSSPGVSHSTAVATINNRRWQGESVAVGSSCLIYHCLTEYKVSSASIKDTAVSPPCDGGGRTSCCDASQGSR